jgi:hypothetical protein
METTMTLKHLTLTAALALSACGPAYTGGGNGLAYTPAATAPVLDPYATEAIEYQTKYPTPIPASANGSLQGLGAVLGTALDLAATAAATYAAYQYAARPPQPAQGLCNFFPAGNPQAHTYSVSCW